MQTKVGTNSEDLQRPAALLGVDKAEEIYGISRWTFRRWAYEGKIASVKLGRRLLIPVAEIERLVSANTRPALQQP